MPHPNYNLFDLFHILSKWKKTIIYVTLIALILSAVVSLILPVYYKSTAIFYPYNLKNFDPRNLDQPSEIFGDKEDSDRLLLIGGSSALENKLISKFDLFKRYEIDKSEKYARTKLSEELRNNINIIKNERSAIEITVYDKDPKVAADMANETVKLIDEINKAPVIENYTKILNVFKSQVDAKYDELDSLSNSIRTIKKQSEYKNANAYFDDLKNADVRVTSELVDALAMKEKYQRAVLFYNSNMPSIFIIEPAIVAERKAKPIRWIIVASSTFIALVLISMLAIFMEIYNNNEVKTHEGRS
jgi:uncharacterized protein involved in exopolysaccharide biosynthesis